MFKSLRARKNSVWNILFTFSSKNLPSVRSKDKRFSEKSLRKSVHEISFYQSCTNSISSLVHQIFFKLSYDWISVKGPILFELPTSKVPSRHYWGGQFWFSKKKLGSRTHLAFIFLVSLLLKSWLQKRTAKQDACVRDNIISRSTRLPSNIVARGWSWFRDLEIEKAILVWRLRKS